MIALLLALSLSAPAAAVAPLAEPAPDPAPMSKQEQFLQLQALFDQSCAQRAYATYVNLCETLKDQLKTAQREAERAKARRGVVIVTSAPNP